MPVSEFDASRTVTSGALCPQHSKELGRYCEDDRTALCTNCMPDHKDHKSVALEEKRNEVAGITESHEAVTRLLAELDKTTATLRERARSLDEQTSEAIKHINETMDEVCLH